MAIRAPHLTVGSDFSCDDGFTAEGLVDLTDAHVIGELSLNKATLSNPGDFALLAPRLIIDKDMFCRDGFVADGTVCLIGAHIAGRLSFTGAHLAGTKLTVDRLREAGIAEMFIDDVVKNELETKMVPLPKGDFAKVWRVLTSGVLPIVRIGAEKTRKKPRMVKIVYGKDGLALIADGLHVDIDMTCDTGFISKGEIRLKGARIGQNLDFNDAELIAEADAEKGTEVSAEKKIATALDVEDMQANRMLMPARCWAGRISLRNAKIVELDDKLGMRPDQIDLRGFSYEMLTPLLDVKVRLQWLKENNYDPQSYEMLARSYWQAGLEEAARRVHLDHERRQRKDLPPGGRKIWGYLQDWTVGYGYHTYRAVALFGSVLLVGSVGFWLFPPTPILIENGSQFNSIFYTLDLLFPFADFGQRDLWNSTYRNEIFKIALAVAGWTILGVVWVMLTFSGLGAAGRAGRK